MIEVRRQFAHVNGIKLHYREAGSGPALLLLHGWPQTSHAWRHVAERLASRYRIIAPDLRGLGDSSKPATGYDKKTVAADVIALAEHLGISRAHVMGHDWGAVVAFMMAATKPALVATCTVMEVVLPIDFPHVPALRREGGIWHLAFHTARDLPEALVSGRERVYFDWFFRGGAHDPSALGEDDVAEYVRAYSAPGGLRASFEWYRAMFDDMDDIAPFRTNQCAVPAMAIGAAQSFGTMTAKSFSAVFADVRGETIDRCGHWIPEEQPDALVALFSNFVEGRQ